MEGQRVVDPMEARAGRKDPEARGINGDGYSSNRSLDRLQVTLHDRELALPSFERHREPANDVNLTPGGGKVGTGTGPEDRGGGGGWCGEERWEDSRGRPALISPSH